MQAVKVKTLKCNKVKKNLFGRHTEQTVCQSVKNSLNPLKYTL